jgi:hypothetical protein
VPLIPLACVFAAVAVVQGVGWVRARRHLAPAAAA